MLSLFSKQLFGAPQRMQFGNLQDMIQPQGMDPMQTAAVQPTAQPRMLSLDNLRNNFRDILSPEIGMQVGAEMMAGKDFGDSLSRGFSAAGKGIGIRREERKAEAQKTKTYQALSKIYPEMAPLLDAGLSPSEAWTMTRGGKDEIINAGDGRLYNATQKTWITAPGAAMPGGPDPKKAFEYETGLRKEYGDEDTVKAYKKVRDSYERVRAAAQTDSGPGDIGLIFNYMKMLDPGSVVREGEFATAENAGGAGAQIANIYNKLLTGERLTPELREQFVAAADKLYSEMSANVSETNQQFSKSAQRWGVDPAAVVMEPEKYEPIKLGVGQRITRGNITIEKLSD